MICFEIDRRILFVMVIKSPEQWFWLWLVFGELELKSRLVILFSSFVLRFTILFFKCCIEFFLVLISQKIIIIACFPVHVYWIPQKFKFEEICH